MSGRRWNEHAGEVVFHSVEVLEKFAALLKNDLVLIAEKERSLGFLNESMEDVLTDLSANQFEKAKQVINYFIGSLTQIEYSRKILYHRTHQLAQGSFQSTIEQAKTVKELLKQREIAITRYLQAKSVQARSVQPRPGLEQRISQAGVAFKSLNQQSIQSAGTFANQLHRDLVLTLGSFAHAQMELYAKQMEVWAKTVEEIDQISLDEDTEDVAEQMQKIMSFANLAHDDEF